MSNENKIEQEENELLQKMAEINKLMPPPIKITKPFVEIFYNQFNVMVSILSSTES